MSHTPVRTVTVRNGHVHVSYTHPAAPRAGAAVHASLSTPRAATSAAATPVPSPYTTYPTSTSGRLFGTDARGDFACSGTSIASRNGAVIWTAGHCVIDPSSGILVSRMIYVPGYQNHTAPLGVWIIKGFEIPHQYSVDPNNEAYDYGTVLAAPIAGKSLVEDVGGRDIAFGTDPSTITYDAFGYPAEAPFDGETMQSCTSGVTQRDSGVTPQSLGISCDMNEGSSGGGWIAHGTNILSSNVAYGKTNAPGVVFGPFLDSDAQAMFQDAQTWDIAGPLPGQSPPASPAAVTAPVDSAPPVISHVVAKPSTFKATSCKTSSTHVTKLAWSMDEPSVHTTVTIKTPKGSLVATINALLLQGGWYFPWNGCNQNAKLEPAGKYKFTVKAVDIAGNVSKGVSNTVKLTR